MSYEISVAAGTRHCHPCSAVIKKGSSFLLRWISRGSIPEYMNYCPSCGIRELKKIIDEEVRCLNELDRLSKWDE